MIRGRRVLFFTILSENTHRSA